MDFEFFEQLSDDGARAYLDRYLDVESREIAESLRDAQADGVPTDFSVESVPAFFSWLVKFIKPVVKEPDPDMPEWMRQAHESVGGTVHFADESSPLVLRGSYYLGESFIRSYPQLKWGLGRLGTAEQRMPVVTGFKGGDQMPPLLVAENIVSRSLGSGNSDHIENAVVTWKKSIPSR